jgi:hypothetical protein
MVASADWGNVPQWVSGVGSVLAFSLALALGLRQESRRRRDQRDDEVRQARLVVVGEPVFVPEHAGVPGFLAVRITNFSDQPVHEVVTGAEVWRSGCPEPRTQYIEVSYLAPGEDREFALDVPEGEGSLSSGMPRVWFIDVHGRRWTRVANDVEPERVYDYIDPRMPADLRAAIEQARGERSGFVRRLRQRLGRG